jgi:Ser-Thr-rich glycosyl-phosphatidyl-inositol-anchored membrane family
MSSFKFIAGVFLISCTCIEGQEAFNPIQFPTTGSVLTVGTNANIIWKNNTSGNVSVILWKGDPGALNVRDVIADNIENIGSVLWPIDGSLLSGNDYSIMVTVGDENALDVISFTPLFTIVTYVTAPTDPLWTPLETILATPTAAALYQNPITAPKRGTVVMAGALFEITWTKTIGDYVSFELFKGKFGSYKSLGQFAVGVQNTGGYSWSVDPSFVGGSDYILEIWALGFNGTINNGINWSPYFTISSSASSSIEDVVLASVLSTASASLLSAMRTTSAQTSELG